MKSIRLNKNLRCEIESNIEQAYVLNSPAPTVTVPLDALSAKLEALYRKRAMIILRKAEAAGLHEYMDTRNSFLVGFFENNVHRIYFQDAKGNNEHLINLSQNGYFCTEQATNNDQEICNIYAQYRADKKASRPSKLAYSAWEKDKLNYMEDIKNVLLGVNTTGQLLEVWPECGAYLPAGIMNPSSINLPSVSISQLNKKLGI